MAFLNCKYPYWRFSSNKFKKYFFISYLMKEGVDNIEDLKLQNDNLKERIKARREGRNEFRKIMVRYKPRIVK